jgi:dihydropteroate synthase
MYTLNCKGKILNLQTPQVMGILNLTDDSFYEGYLNESNAQLIERAGAMIRAGASILDIGGQSTRPKSTRITATDEAQRVIPAIENILQHFPEAILSIDTYYSEVAAKAVNAGAAIINDISGGNMDPQMIATAGSLSVPYICMHMQGRPETMQENPTYEDVTREVLEFFIQKKQECRKAGIKDLVIDPGFGFGKTIQHNFTLLKNLAAFKILDLPVLAGLSRKSTISKTLNITAAESLNGTTVLNTIALMNGASILRVHDVKEAIEAVKLVEAYNTN